MSRPNGSILTCKSLSYVDEMSIINVTQTSSGLVARRHPPNDVALICSASWAADRPVICCSALSLCCSYQHIHISSTPIFLTQWN